MEQRAAIKFCFKLGKSASETYELLQKVYGSYSLCRSTAFEWFKRFREGCESLEDDDGKARVKTIFIVFFDAQGVIHREFVPEGQTVNGQFYLGVMERLLKRIRCVHPEFHNSKEWFLLHDNVPAHTTSVVARFLARKQVTVFHYPSYSLDLAPADFFLFPKLKSELKGKRFQDISIIQANVTEQIRSIPKDSFKKSFHHCTSIVNRVLIDKGTMLNTEVTHFF
jgi:histone-lysine N-methyltransferase SETMAR